MEKVEHSAASPSTGTPQKRLPDIARKIGLLLMSVLTAQPVAAADNMCSTEPIVEQVAPLCIANTPAAPPHIPSPTTPHLLQANQTKTHGVIAAGGLVPDTTGVVITQVQVPLRKHIGVQGFALGVPQKLAGEFNVGPVVDFSALGNPIETSIGVGCGFTKGDFPTWKLVLDMRSALVRRRVNVIARLEHDSIEGIDARATIFGANGVGVEYRKGLGIGPHIRLRTNIEGVRFLISGLLGHGNLHLLVIVGMPFGKK